MTPDLKQFTQYARANPKLECNAFMGLLFRQEGLLDSFQRLAGIKTPGVDGLKKADYTIRLENRLRDLSSVSFIVSDLCDCERFRLGAGRSKGPSPILRGRYRVTGFPTHNFQLILGHFP